MGTEREWTGRAIEVEEQTKVIIERIVPGANYALRAYNVPRMAVSATAEDTPETLWERLAEQVTDQGFTVEETTIFGTPGISTGLRVDQTEAASYIETVVPGVAPTGKTFRVQLPLGSSGGTWTLTFDFGTGEETTGTISATAVPSAVVSAIEALTTPGSGDVLVTLEHGGDAVTPRSYLITLEGLVAGIDFTMSASGAALTGTAEVQISTIQEAAGNSQEVQALWFTGAPVASQAVQIRFSRGGVYSAWSPRAVNAYNSDSRIATDIETQIASVLGADVVTVTSEYQGDWGGLIVLKWNSTGPQDQVAIEARYYLYPSPGVYYSWGSSSETIRQSGANQNEIIMVKGPDPTGVPSTYDVTWGVTTDSVTTAAGESTLETEWDAITGGSTVYSTPLSGGGGWGLYLVEFNGANANTNVALPTQADGYAEFTVVVAGQPLQNEIQQIVVQADSGTFTLSSDGTNFTSALTYGLSAATLQTALRGLAAIGTGNCDVSGSGTLADPYIVEYVSGKAATDMDLLVATTGSLVGGFDPDLTTISSPTAGVAQVDQLWIDPAATSGFIKLSSGGDFSGQVAFDSSAASAETALEEIADVAAWGLAVVGEAGGPYLLQWTAKGLPPVLSIAQQTLTISGSSIMRLERLVEATGPGSWHNPLNWTGEVVPGTGDTPVLREGDDDIIEGLRQRCGWTRSGDLLALEGGDFVVGQVVRISKEDVDTFPTATISGGGHTLSAATDYTIIGIDRLAQVCQIALSATGAPVVLTGAGSGTFTIGVQLAAFQHHNSYAGDIGLSRRFNGTREERPRELAIGSTLLTIGLGNAGAGMSLGNFDLGAHPCTVRVERTAAAGNGEQAVNLRMNHESSTVQVLGGSVAISPVDLNADLSTVGNVAVQNAAMLLGKVSLNNYDGFNDDLSSPYGATIRGVFNRTAG